MRILYRLFEIWCWLIRRKLTCPCPLVHIDVRKVSVPTAFCGYFHTRAFAVAPFCTTGKPCLGAHCWQNVVGCISVHGSMSLVDIRSFVRRPQTSRATSS